MQGFENLCGDLHRADQPHLGLELHHARRVSKAIRGVLTGDHILQAPAHIAFDGNEGVFGIFALVELGAMADLDLAIGVVADHRR